MNDPATEAEIQFLRMAAPQEFRRMRKTTYEEIRKNIEKHRHDPGFGPDVELALSPRGERWIRHALEVIRGIRIDDEDEEAEPEGDSAGEETS